MDKFTQISREVAISPDTDFNNDFVEVVSPSNHNEVLDKLLADITEVNIREVIGLPDEEDIRQKHILIAVSTHVLNIAKQRNWSLCQAWDYIYLYNGCYWKQCGKEDTRSLLIRAAVKMGIPPYDAAHYEFGDRLLKQFMSDAHLPAPETDKNKILINLQNGTAEFTPDGWKLRDFDKQDFIRYQLPFAYSPEADCPMFYRYLHRVLPDESARLVLQEFCGFIFTKYNLEKCLVLLGPGGNGKSVLFNIVNALIGKENILNYNIGLFSHEYNRSKLVDVLLNYSSEKGFDLSPDIFKALVSGEPLQAREPYGRPFTIHSPIKFIINCNELPRETESTEAYFRRFLILPFNVVIPDSEKDIELSDKIIRHELPGVFNWMIEGLLRIMQNKKFTPCESADLALSEFKKQSDSVELFIEEFGFKQAPDKTALADLYLFYKQFCKDDNYRALGKKRFSQRLESKGFERDRLSNGGTCFRMISETGLKNCF
jgi:putative DNA primase/helicase